jgi:hypothetical protein
MTVILKETHINVYQHSKFKYFCEWTMPDGSICGAGYSKRCRKFKKPNFCRRHVNLYHLHRQPRFKRGFILPKEATA